MVCWLVAWNQGDLPGLKKNKKKNMEYWTPEINTYCRLDLCVKQDLLTWLKRVWSWNRSLIDLKGKYESRWFSQSPLSATILSLAVVVHASWCLNTLCISMLHVQGLYLGTPHIISFHPFWTLLTSLHLICSIPIRLPTGSLLDLTFGHTIFFSSTSKTSVSKSLQQEWAIIIALHYFYSLSS